MSKVFTISTPVPLQPDFVDTMPPHVVRAPLTTHGQKHVHAPPAKPVPPLTSSRSCMELGLCQRRHPACMDCDHDTAWSSGVEGPYHPKPLARRLGQWAARLWRKYWVLLAVWACLASVIVWCVVLTSFVIGYAQHRSFDISLAQAGQTALMAWQAVLALVAQWVVGVMQ